MQYTDDQYIIGTNTSSVKSMVCCHNLKVNCKETAHSVLWARAKIILYNSWFWFNTFWKLLIGHFVLWRQNVSFALWSFGQIPLCSNLSHSESFRDQCVQTWRHFIRLGRAHFWPLTNVLADEQRDEIRMSQMMNTYGNWGKLFRIENLNHVTSRE